MFDLAKVKTKFSEFIRNSNVPPIVKDGDDYYVFQHYTIRANNGYYDLYERDEFVDTVSSTASAISWCKAKQARLTFLARDIIKADRRVANQETAVMLRKHHYKTVTDKEDRDTLHILVNEDVYKLRQLKHNLKKLIKQTKYIKIKGFDNELN